MAAYECKMYGMCEKADAHEVLEIPAGVEAKCPGCGSVLHSPSAGTTMAGVVADPTQDGIPPWLIPVLIAAVVIVLIGGGSWWWSSRKSVPSGTTAAGTAGVTPAVMPGTTPGVVPGVTPGTTQPEPVSPAVPPANPGGTGEPGDADIQRLVKTSEDAIKQHRPEDARIASNQSLALLGVRRARAFFKAGRVEDADAELAEALSKDPDCALAYYNRAVIRLRQGRREESIADLRRCIEKGFSDIAGLAHDADFAALRADEQFRALTGPR